jgi:hypothetical protein
MTAGTKEIAKGNMMLSMFILISWSRTISIKNMPGHKQANTTIVIFT